MGPSPTYSLFVIEPGSPVEIGETVLRDGARVIYCDTDALGPLVHVETGVVNHRLVATRVEVEMPDRKPVTAEVLKSIRLPDILDEVVRAATIEARFASAGGRMPAEEYEKARATRNSRRRITPDFLREVAAVAAAHPDRRTKAVQEHLHTSHRNATRWIAAAQKYLTEEDNK